MVKFEERVGQATVRFWEGVGNSIVVFGEGVGRHFKSRENWPKRLRRKHVVEDMYFVAHGGLCTMQHNINCHLQGAPKIAFHISHPDL